MSFVESQRKPDDKRARERAKKVVNYSTFGGGDDDDDFADPTPPTKKSKSACTNKEPTCKSTRVKAVVQESVRVEEKTLKHRTSSNRQPLDEKLFDRDLEAALKLSLVSSQEGESISQAKSTPALETSTEAVSTGNNSSGKRLLGSVVEEDDDIIELSSETTDTNPPKRRRAASKCVTYDGDSDGGGDDEPWAPKHSQEQSDRASEDDDDDDEFDPDDSDSDYGPAKKKKNKKPEKAKTAAKKTPVKPRAKATITGLVTPVSKKKSVSSKVAAPNTMSRSSPSTPSVSCSTPVRTGGVALKRSWVPPGRSGSLSSPLGAASMKSPSAGLRLGLSRNQKVKSLHPSVTCS